jgi:TonB family protein
MYFDFEDYHPDITPVGRAISWREGVLLSIIVHLVFVIILIAAPKWLPDLFKSRAVQPITIAQGPRDSTRFVFVQPRIERPAPKPPQRGELSDRDRVARAPEHAPNPINPLPFSRGNTPERTDVDRTPPSRAAQPQPSPPQQAANTPPAQTPGSQQQPDSAAKLPDSKSGLQMPNARTTDPLGMGRPVGGVVGNAIQNLQRYIDRQQFDNPGGGGGQFGPEIQFDTKGVEFGPWIRRFIAQVKRNWLIPYAAMSMKGHVVITFNVHKDGSISDLTVVGPCPVDAFNNAAFGALASSNPTQPLPPEYPSDKAFFTVTFFYNEQPPQ